MIRRLLLIIMCTLFVMTGCSESTGGSYEGIVKVNGKEFILKGGGENPEFTIGQKIGEIRMKVDPDVYPKSNFSSNIASKGAELYFSKEDDKILIVKIQDGSYMVFVER
ncbi:hypothetical protein [Pseudalkalibacillus sp. SCS-8]|uniref:hypothetical protein n=1 Tax=Pseudalkalibacillus nanhaiensis TaxID=3115291 RepID=UPI0032DAB32D